jgi:predicted ATPase
MLGSSLLYIGELVSARAHLEQGIALYDPQQSRSLAFSRGTDPGVVCLSRVASTLWLLGYPDRALARSHEALTLAQKLSHTYSLAFALHFAAMLHECRREAQLVQEHAEASMALSSEQGFVQWLGWGMITRGWALAERGSTEEGIVQLRQGLATLGAMGADLGQTHMLVRLAGAYARGGQTEEGLRLLAEALSAVHKNGERHYEAELYRLRGELLLQQVVGRDAEAVHTHTSRAAVRTAHTPSLQTEAETCFRQAIDVARHQCAKSLELRAVMSLSRLWQKQGRRAEARQMLAELYGWFTEGFDTSDLQEAKALLEALQ